MYIKQRVLFSKYWGQKIYFPLINSIAIWPEYKAISVWSYHIESDAVQSIFWGGTPQFIWSFMYPYLPLFIAFLLTNFRKFSKFGVLCPAIFFKKFSKISPKFSEIFSTFSKSKKPIIFAPKIVQNRYINQNVAKFSLKTPKIANFP